MLCSMYNKSVMSADTAGGMRQHILFRLRGNRVRIPGDPVTVSREFTALYHCASGMAIAKEKEETILREAHPREKVRTAMICKSGNLLNSKRICFRRKQIARTCCMDERNDEHFVFEETECSFFYGCSETGICTFLFRPDVNAWRERKETGVTVHNTQGGKHE